MTTLLQDQTAAAREWAAGRAELVWDVPTNYAADNRWRVNGTPICGCTAQRRVVVAELKRLASL